MLEEGPRLSSEIQRLQNAAHDLQLKRLDLDLSILLEEEALVKAQLRELKIEIEGKEKLSYCLSIKELNMGGGIVEGAATVLVCQCGYMSTKIFFWGGGETVEGAAPVPVCQWGHMSTQISQRFQNIPL